MSNSYEIGDAEAVGFTEDDCSSEFEQGLIGSSMSISEQILSAKLSKAEDALRDLIRGADMCIPYFKGAAQHYMQEVKRVATAGLLS